MSLQAEKAASASAGNSSANLNIEESKGQVSFGMANLVSAGMIATDSKVLNPRCLPANRCSHCTPTSFTGHPVSNLRCNLHQKGYFIGIDAKASIYRHSKIVTMNPYHMTCP